ncbi:hypothetical protein GUJ93_ZPchr0013g34574 [Zizania palustris]|uniref:NB-ARC domain-containing protein n=1 Tax=Zizania palustris TaxID=103762 RepID=A0A8J5X8H1_ZIZPA|nr:hypothetical protein GUJ93_ZPchr0013g34574 [Zizania palustris]
MDLGDEHAGMILSARMRISKVVEKLRLYLGNSSDSFKSTTKKLDVLDDKLHFLSPDNLQLVKPDKEEAAAAWLRRVEKVVHDAEGLLEDMESEVKAHNSSDSSVMTWLSSDNGNMIRMIYIISKLASVYSEGESIVDTPRLNGSASEDKISLSSVSMTSQNKSLPNDDFLIGRDQEIAMIRDMVLDNAHYVAEPTSLEFRKQADQPHISQKVWIIETLQKIDLSKRAEQATEVSPYLKNEMGNKVGYNSTVTYLRNPAVIPIVGVSGVGKSALAQLIFNDRNVQEYFGDLSAWVYMTDKINQLDVIKKIIYSFDPKYGLSDVINLESAHIKLQNVIEGKRFLLVLDDVWDDVIQKGLGNVLSKGAPGSVVLVTTQLFSVADSVGTAGPIILDPLETDDSWTLLKSFAFGGPCQSLSTESLEETGRKITHSLGIVIPNDMSALKHLRYLDLSFTGITRVPDSVCSLCLLQVLGLRGCTLDKLPGNMNSLINLRLLHASSDTIAKINGIGKLTKLQELRKYHVKAEDGHRISELRDMNDLRGSLSISKLEMVTNPSEAVEANIVGKKYLTTLELRWYPNVREDRPLDLAMKILEGLSPPTYLQELTLFSYSGFAFPEWLGQLKHVRTVEISSCKNLKVLPPLGQLENLLKLKLDNLPSIKDIGSKFYGTSSMVFPSLEELSFEDMKSWESWMYAGSNDFIPNLQKLRICYCRKLSNMPFESLSPSIKEIVLLLSLYGSLGDTVSRYLQRQTVLTWNIIPQTPFLRYLRLDGMRNLTSDFEQWLQQLTSLQELELSSLYDLPSSLTFLSSLKKLTLKYYQWIESNSLPAVPGNLKELQIEECPLELEVRFQDPNGEEPKGPEMVKWRNKKREEWREEKMEEWREEKMEQWRIKKMKKWLNKKMEEWRMEENKMQMKLGEALIGKGRSYKIFGSEAADSSYAKSLQLILCTKTMHICFRRPLLVQRTLASQVLVTDSWLYLCLYKREVEFYFMDLVGFPMNISLGFSNTCGVHHQHAPDRGSCVLL